MSRLIIVATVALLAAVSVSPRAEANGFDETSGTFQLHFGPEILVDGSSAIAVEGEISDSGEGPWTGTISGWLTLTESHRDCGYDYVGEWTITRGNATSLVERVKGTLIFCPIIVGEPHLFGSSRAQSAENGKIVGFRSFDGDLNAAVDAVSGTWNGRFRTD